jgi:hypothetical protein
MTSMPCRAISNENSKDSTSHHPKARTPPRQHSLLINLVMRRLNLRSQCYWPPAPQLFNWSFSVVEGELRQFFPIKRDMMSQLHPPCLLLSYREDSRLQLCCLQSLIPLSSRHSSALLDDLHCSLLTGIASKGANPSSRRIWQIFSS